jgi:hypothetical protein
MDSPIVSFTSNNPTITCMGTQMSFKKLITITKISTLPQDIHISKLINITVDNARCITMDLPTKEGRVLKPTKIKDTKCQQMERENYCLKVVLPSNIKLIKRKPQTI